MMKRTTKKLVTVIVAVLLLLYGYAQENGISLPGSSEPDSSGAARLQQAFDNQQSDLQVRASGVVDRLLKDDLKGAKHQRFILRLKTGQRVLVAHNIDLAPRIRGLQAGDMVEFFGEYEWNAKGGVIHWTHLDPNGRHVGGWLKHQGKTYE